MPRIVDRQARRAELAIAAAQVFSEKGYSGLGMREIAKRLGVSKSALYHYFPTKHALFEACAAAATKQSSDSLWQSVDPDAPLHIRVEQLVAEVLRMEDYFLGEFYLLMDYLRGRSADSIAADQNMRAADKRFVSAMAKALGCGKERAAGAWCLLMGGLVQRLFDGRTTTDDDIAGWLKRLVHH